MTDVDTNVIVRLLTEDEPGQAAAARQLFAANPLLDCKTVLLETAWVLRSIYWFREGAVQGAFSQLLGLENVHVEDHQSVKAALALTAAGIEIADAIHLTSHPPDAEFVTFNRQLVRHAQRAGIKRVAVVTPKRS